MHPKYTSFSCFFFLLFAIQIYQIAILSDTTARRSAVDQESIKALLNEKFEDFYQKLILIEEKFDTTDREIYIKMEQTEKKAEDVKANASNNSDEIEFKV